MRRFAISLVLAASLSSGLNAQSLARDVVASDGLVQVVFPARPNVCGDGRSFIRIDRGNHGQSFVGGSVYGYDGWRDRPCSFGPARALVSVASGQVARLNVFVGPAPSEPATRTINASAADAVAWLVDLARQAPSRVASTAIQTITIAAAPTPWETLVRIARDADRPRDVRRSATTWLSFGVNEKLGLDDVDEHGNDDAELRSQAVFVLSQRPKAESVPELIELARTAKNAVVRKGAIFWLGQSGDPRAVDVYADLLGIR